MGLGCRLFGHTFLVRNIEADGCQVTKPSDWCTKCGMTKDEMYWRLGMGLSK